MIDVSSTTCNQEILIKWNIDFQTCGTGCKGVKEMEGWVRLVPKDGQVVKI